MNLERIKKTDKRSERSRGDDNKRPVTGCATGPCHGLLVAQGEERRLGPERLSGANSEYAKNLFPPSPPRVGVTIRAKCVSRTIFDIAVVWHCARITRARTKCLLLEDFIAYPMPQWVLYRSEHLDCYGCYASFQVAILLKIILEHLCFCAHEIGENLK